jgi:hypothetical protein
MKVMLVISLYSYLYLKLANTIYLSYYLLCFLFNKIREQEGRTGSARKWVGAGRTAGGVAPRTYPHVSKCKNANLKG